MLPASRQRKRDDGIQQLNSDIESMEMKFVRLQLSLRDSLKERNISSGRLADFLMNHSSFRSVMTNKQALRLSNQQSDLENAGSIDEIFSVISPFWSFIDYRLLEEIINDLGADADQGNLAGYTTSFKEFLDSWKVDPCKICCHKNVLQGSQVKLYFKLDKLWLDTDTLLICRDVKAAIARIFSLKVTELQLYSIEEGCIELVFLSPDITQHLPLSTEKNEALYSLRPSVLKVTLVDESETETVIFEVCSVITHCNCCWSIANCILFTCRESTICLLISKGGGYHSLKW